MFKYILWIMVGLQNINFRSLEMFPVTLNYFHLGFTRRSMILFFLNLFFIEVKLKRRFMILKVVDGRFMYIVLPWQPCSWSDLEERF